MYEQLFSGRECKTSSLIPTGMPAVLMQNEKYEEAWDSHAESIMKWFLMIPVELAYLEKTELCGTATYRDKSQFDNPKPRN